MVQVTRWTPFAPAFQLRRDIDDLFGRFFGQVASEGGRSSTEWANWTPAIEGYEEDGHWVIRVALPGVDPKDVDVALADGQLTIKGQREPSSKGKNDSYFARELNYGTFERTLTVPEGVDPAKISARYIHGVLEVRVPKPVAETPRKVAIQVAEAPQKTA